MDFNETNLATEAIKQVAKDAYQDGGKPVIKPTGELVGLLPRTIKAALAPLEKWILHREYSIAETEKLLEQKLLNTPPELIEPPEPYIAVPALQSISYCMDNEDLREMYANLLASSMNKALKGGVHPSSSEIIKQLSPDEAKLLKVLYQEKTIPTITLKYTLMPPQQGNIDIIRHFSDAGEQAGCESPYEIEKYLDNLSRLGIGEHGFLSSIADKSVYEPLKTHSFIQSKMTIPQGTGRQEFEKTEIEESYFRLTAFGLSFCSTCVVYPEVHIFSTPDTK
jgi:hypothetical protein